MTNRNTSTRVNIRDIPFSEVYLFIYFIREVIIKMKVQKRGCIVGNNINPSKSIETEKYKVFKMGYVVKYTIEKRNSITDVLENICSRGFTYFQITNKNDACEKCLKQSGAIYPVTMVADGGNLPPFHTNCKCEIIAFGADNLNGDPGQNEILKWLDIIHGDYYIDDMVVEIMDFYKTTNISEQQIRHFLTETGQIKNIIDRINAFIYLLNDPLEPIKIAAEDLSQFGWNKATREEADKLNSAFERYGIFSRESIIQFLATAAQESNYGSWLLEIGSEDYFESKIDYDKNDRGAGYIQITGRTAHLAFLKSMDDDFTGEDTASYIAENYPLEASVWYWLNKDPFSGGLNEFIDTSTAKGGNPELIFLKTSYYVNGVRGGNFNDDINDAIYGRASYRITDDKLIINNNKYTLPNGWEEREDTYEEASDIWRNTYPFTDDIFDY